jgi:26S proteasome regulatory subunit N2
MLACTPAVLQVLQLLIRLYEDCPEPDYSVICQCLMFLDDAPGVAKILNQLISSSGVSRGIPE